MLGRSAAEIHPERDAARGVTADFHHDGEVAATERRISPCIGAGRSNSTADIHAGCSIAHSRSNKDATRASSTFSNRSPT